MKLKEVKQPSDKKLFEEIDKNNDTGFLTEDLVQIVRATDGPWKEVTSEQLEEDIKRAMNG